MKLTYPETDGGWKKYEGNPVLGSSEIGTCFDVPVLKDENGYAMHFSWRPKKALAVVKGPDGIHWSEPDDFKPADPFSSDAPRKSEGAAKRCHGGDWPAALRGRGLPA